MLGRGPAGEGPLDDQNQEKINSSWKTAMKVLVDEENWSTLERISKTSFPNEAAAAIVGSKEGGNYWVEDVIETENLLESPTAFEMGPESIAEVLENVEEKGLDLIGFFHSHPRLTAYVSDRDERFMSLWPGKIWIIAGTGKEGEVTEVKAFKATEEGVDSLEVKKPSE